MNVDVALPPFKKPLLRTMGDIKRWMSRPWSAWEEQPLIAPSGVCAPPSVHRATMNNRYLVQISTVRHTVDGHIDHLWIRRHDAEPVRSWSDVQRIKREVLIDGTDRIGIEVYPRDRDIVDAANLYHLWVYPVGFRLPFTLGTPGLE